MRRKEFAMTDDNIEDVNAFLEEMTFGFLGTIGEDGYPNITPLNYVYYNGDIYFHGSKIGEKMSSLAANSKVSFSVAKEYSIIPSYMNDPKYACPATAFFKSVLFRGQAEIVHDLQEKCEVFTVFMEKLQSEGGYDAILPSDQGYAKQVTAAAIVKIRVEEMTSKFKFGQNWSEKKIKKVSDQLIDRDQTLDHETVRLMNLYCPHMKDQAN
ncbi:pyridoxamine 5'-phosphate oxidase family protein [Paenibacillus endoradicis]|uniref:pyridoxamine 5'-phosphate oxidase family protein n=1 Tax=Paenibacillus endoradicis TaxID=2972487 RepID=UPI002158D9D6|nr:pyridoxamine 5'-phosphate oxidase family protein [Paenibacillus endoradicis]MCR8657999.1 pyridoxamine 5'-phosphate oxidase family protein [Paenibacillus endoradicis]